MIGTDKGFFPLKNPFIGIDPILNEYFINQLPNIPLSHNIFEGDITMMEVPVPVLE